MSRCHRARSMPPSRAVQPFVRSLASLQDREAQRCLPSPRAGTKETSSGGARSGPCAVKQAAESRLKAAKALATASVRSCSVRAHPRRRALRAFSHQQQTPATADRLRRRSNQPDRQSVSARTLSGDRMARSCRVPAYHCAMPLSPQPEPSATLLSALTRVRQPLSPIAALSRSLRHTLRPLVTLCPTRR